MNRKIPNPFEFRKLRRRAGLTQEGASRAVGKTHSHCEAIESGRYDIGINTFRLYVVVFNASPFDVLKCLDLLQFDPEIVKKYEQRCGNDGKDPMKTLEKLMRFYALRDRNLRGL